MAGERRDYYEVLGVPRDADEKAIKSAFRALAMSYHPDRNPEPEAEKRFKEIAEAYAVLSDPRKRADYDAHGFAGVSGISPDDLYHGIDLADLFGGLGFDFGVGGLGGLFGGARPRGPVPGAHLRVAIEVDLETVASGGEERVRVGAPHACSVCKGKGAKPGTEPRICDACHGSGQKVTSRDEGGVHMQQITTCPGCSGRGRFIDDPCAECHGRGEVPGDETLHVRIPRGVEDGAVLRIPGKGMPSADPAGPPGDLHVIVRTKPDSRFMRRGSDLFRQESIELPDAVLGTEVDVPTLDGRVHVRVPPGSRGGTLLRVPGKGLPHFRDEGVGDLYLQLHLHVPRQVDAEERRLWEQLRRLREQSSVADEGGA
jgi:molecular chaperone DnaJ